MAQKLVYTAEEVAEMLQISPDTVRKLVRRGRLPKVELDANVVRVPAWAVEELLKHERSDLGD